MAEPVFQGAKAGGAQGICVVVHGRGQTQADMQDSIVNRLEAPGIRFVLPKSAGVGWYQARAIDPLTPVTRAELAQSLTDLAAVIAQAQAADPGRPLVLAGFSQGACLAVEYLLAGRGGVAAACLFTGCRVGDASDDLPLSGLAGMPVYASCGDADPWIPADAYHALLRDLTRAGARVRTDMFPGRPHAVTPTEIAVLQGMLRDVTGAQHPFDEVAYDIA